MCSAVRGERVPREACNRPERIQDRRTRQVDRRCTRLQQTVGGTCHPNGGKSCLHTFHLWSPMCKVPMTADHQIIVRRVADWHASCCPSPRQGAVQLPRCCHNVAEDTKHKSDGREPTRECRECEFWVAPVTALSLKRRYVHMPPRESTFYSKGTTQKQNPGAGDAETCSAGPLRTPSSQHLARLSSPTIVRLVAAKNVSASRAQACEAFFLAALVALRYLAASSSCMATLLAFCEASQP